MAGELVRAFGAERVRLRWLHHFPPGCPDFPRRRSTDLVLVASLGMEVTRDVARMVCFRPAWQRFPLIGAEVTSRHFGGRCSLRQTDPDR